MNFHFKFNSQWMLETCLKKYFDYFNCFCVIEVLFREKSSIYAKCVIFHNVFFTYFSRSLIYMKCVIFFIVFFNNLSYSILFCFNKFSKVVNQRYISRFISDSY